MHAPIGDLLKSQINGFCLIHLIQRHKFVNNNEKTHMIAATAIKILSFQMQRRREAEKNDEKHEAYSLPYKIDSKY